MGKNIIHGMLSNVYVTLPFKSEKERKKAEENEKEFGFSFARQAMDWGYTLYDKKKPIKFESGDLVKIFETVTDGDILWSGKVDLEREREKHKAETGYEQQAIDGFWVHGFQRDLEPKEWASMFFKKLPAKLEKDGKTIFGALEPFSETGTEGIIWSLHEYGVSGYEGLHCLSDGDEITVYSNVRDGKIAWEGVLDFADEKPEEIDWHEINRRTNHMDTRDWLYLCFGNNPIALTKG